MASIEAKILHRIPNGEGRVQALTGSIGGVVFQSKGFGDYHQVSEEHNLGFQGRWASGKSPPININDNKRYIAEEVADSIYAVCKARGFGGDVDKGSAGYVDRVHLGSASAPVGIEVEIQQILLSKHNLIVTDIVRDSLACNGTVWALTQEAQVNKPGRRAVVATFEHTTPFIQGPSLMQDLFGDGVTSIAFESGDISVLATNTLFEQDRTGVLTLPHNLANTLPPQEGREAFIPNGTCTVVGDEGSVFDFNHGVWQPLAPSEGDEATMNGKELLRYFGNETPGIMIKTFEEYAQKLSDEQIKEQLNPYGVIHQPSRPVLQSLINRIVRSKNGMSDFVKHEWTPGLEGSSLHHNNVSGATIGFSLLNMIETGHITKSDIMFTSMGVGNNITSTIFRFQDRS